MCCIHLSSYRYTCEGRKKENRCWVNNSSVRVMHQDYFKTEDFSPWFHSPNHILYVLSDLVSGLQTKEVKVPQQVVVEGQELEIELWKGEAPYQEE